MSGVRFLKRARNTEYQVVDEEGRLMKITLVVGTRPQIIKSAPVIEAAEIVGDVELEIVHTGQHYDYEMSRVFFDQMDLPDPIVNLDVGSGSHAWQTGEILMRLEKVILNRKPDLVLVPGDTNSTLAGSLSAVKLLVPVGHIEAGARSHDMRMPEEVNRRLTDHCSELLFAPSENCAENLREEGIQSKRIFLTGDTMYDALLKHIEKASRSKVLDDFDLTERGYLLLTVHRQENVDNPRRLKNIADAIIKFEELQTVFPAHPRTVKQLCSLDLYAKLQKQKKIKIISPVGYSDMINLQKNAGLILTDSGGIQKEAFWLHVPCITLRDNTEWVETVNLGANILVGSETARILKAIESILDTENAYESLMQLPNPFGDGEASNRIANIIREYQR